MQLFYCPDIDNSIYTLNEEESKHCIRVLRMHAGDRFQITDGRGNLFEVEITDEHPKRCSVRVISTLSNYEAKDFFLHIAVAPTKNISRFEWFLEKATEMGIHEISPIICDHSERKDVKTSRLEKVIIAAIKQSLKVYLPKLNPSLSFSSFIKQDFKGQKFIAYCDGDHINLKDQYQLKEDVCILIGPEGDFSPEEVNLALKCGFKTISLGKSRLRTETAAIAACHTINLLNE